MARDLPPERPDEPDEPERRPGDTPHHGDEERWDPIVGDGGTRLSDMELRGERTWLNSPDRPPRLDETRPYDVRGGLVEPAPRDQWALEDAVPKDDVGEPERFPEARNSWVDLINGGGPAADPFRENNCLDCSLAFLSTWHGEPQVAAPRYPEYRADGAPSRAGETHGLSRAEQWLGMDYSLAGIGPPAFEAIEDKLRDAGHGSAANIVAEWRPDWGVGAHAWDAVNDGGEIVWVDSQMRRMADHPLYADGVARVWSIAIDREGRPL